MACEGFCRKIEWEMITVISSAPVGCKITMCQVPWLSITTHILARTPKKWVKRIQCNLRHWATAVELEDCRVLLIATYKLNVSKWCFLAYTDHRHLKWQILCCSIYLAKLVLNQQIPLFWLHYSHLAFYCNDTIFLIVRICYFNYYTAGSFEQRVFV